MVDLKKLESYQHEFNIIVEIGSELLLKIIGEINNNAPDYQSFFQERYPNAYEKKMVGRLDDYIEQRIRLTDRGAFARYSNAATEFLEKFSIKHTSPDIVIRSITDKMYVIADNQVYLNLAAFIFNLNNRFSYLGAIPYYFIYTGNKIKFTGRESLEQNVSRHPIYGDDLRISKPEFTVLLNKIDLLRLYASSLQGNKRELMLKTADQLHEAVVNASDETPPSQHTKDTISALLRNARKIAGQDRNLKDIISHIVFACAILGLGLLIMFGNKLYNGSFFLNRTVRQVIIDQISTEMSNMNYT